MNLLYIIFVYTAFGIGAGIRYIYFLLIGKRRKYDDLIAPNKQIIWNMMISMIVISIFVFFVKKYDAKVTKHPSIEILMNKKY